MIQVGDLVTVKLPNDEPMMYIVRLIHPNGIYISSEKEPEKYSLILSKDDSYSVSESDLPFEIIFFKAPSLEMLGVQDETKNFTGTSG